MNTQIASLILSRIRTADFPWAEKTAGLVRAISTKAKKGGGKTDILPIAADVLGSADCEPSAIDHLLPDQRYRSILFIECSEFPTRKDERIGSPSWAGKYRIIVWMDCSRVGGGAGCGDVAYENLVTALDVPMFDADPFRAVVFRVVGGGPARGREIFGKYTMNEERSQYLHYPFDYFALDLQVDFVLPKGCEDQLAEDNVNCWEPPSSSGPTPSANQPCPPIRTCDTPEDGDVPRYVSGEVVWQAPDSVITDHGALSGLSDDDHPQYLNNARGDVRYDALGAASAAQTAAITAAATDATTKANAAQSAAISAAATDATAKANAAQSASAPLSHTHAISDVTGLQSALNGKQDAGSYAAASHTHAISDVTGLQTALDGKQPAGSYAASTHTHAIADVTGLQTALDGKQALAVVQAPTPTTGQTQTFNILSKDETIACLHSTTIAAQTFVLPSNANSTIGQELVIFSRSAITAVTLTANGNTVYGASFTTIAASGIYRIRKVAASAWVRV